MFSSQAHPPSNLGRGRGVMRVAVIVSLVPLSTTLGACSGDTARTLALDAGYGPKTVAAPDFVAESRGKQTPDFMNVGIDAPKRTIRPKSTP